MKTPPESWPRLTSALVYRDAAKAIDWLCDAFGFAVRLKVEGEGGRIEHSELTLGDGVIMVAQERGKSDDRSWRTQLRSPASLGGANTQTLMAYVDDAEAHCSKARASGARIAEEPATHDYGEDHWADRSYGAFDIEGHFWWFTQRLRNPPS
jgi:uncharacterized glyoxalase superfamily protein PhnB